MNKIICNTLIVISFVTAIGCSYSPNTRKNSQAVEMLRQFYIAKSKIKSTPQNISKMDSLQNKYCSKKLQEKLKEQFQLTGLDHDLLTKDYGIDSLGVKTLHISKDLIKDNNYIVSYTILDDVVPKVSKKEVKVVIKVTVKKEDGKLKVDAIN